MDVPDKPAVPPRNDKERKKPLHVKAGGKEVTNEEFIVLAEAAVDAPILEKAEKVSPFMLPTLLCCVQNQTFWRG